MTNQEKYNKAFMEALEVDECQLMELEYQSIDAWDSVGHMNLIGELEDTFEIEMETDDVIAFSSYKKGIEILAKYNIII